MQTRSKFVALVAVSASVAVISIGQKAAFTATPQASAPANVAVSTASPAQSVAMAIPDTTIAINSPTPMSQRIVHYQIDAKYDPPTHAIDATEVLTYHNLTGQALDHFPFHLYQNAFQPNSTWVREAKRDGSRDTGYDKWDPKEFGSEEIKSIEVVGQGDLTSAIAFHRPR